MNDKKPEIVGHLEVTVHGTVKGFIFSGESVEDAANRLVLDAELHGNNGPSRIYLGRDPKDTIRRRDLASGPKKRYFVKDGEGPEREVTQDEYVATERSAGFRPKPGCGPEATASFSSGRLSGRVEYVTDEHTKTGGEDTASPSV